MTGAGVVDSTAELKQLIAKAANSYRSVGDTVYAILREAITTGTFAPGEWLRQEALAETMGVSRVPVRSALIHLESEGLVVLQPRRGMRVRTLTVEQLRESYELRIVLESHALRMSMGVMTPQRLAGISDLAGQLDGTAEGPAFLAIRKAFYVALYDGARHPMLVKMIEDLRDVVGLYLLRKRMSGHRRHSHRRLLDAVATGDVEVAVRALVDHLQEVRDGVEVVLLAEPDAAG